jgi:hypothetical protein
VQRAFVVAEVALSVLLLVGAALIGRGFARLASWDPGFDTAPVATVWLSASPGRYPQGEQVSRLFARVADEVAAVPGVDSATVGSRVRIHERELAIVGVAADVPPLRPDAPQAAEIYWPQRQAPRWGSYLIYRRSPASGAVDRAVAARIASVDAELSPGGATPLATELARRMVRPRFVVWLASLFAAVALLLATIGTSGVLAFDVAGRTREIGLRMALGASPERVRRQVIVRGLALVAGGVLLGLVAAVATTGALRSLLYGLPPADPAALGGALALFVAAALVACAVPARRAAAVEPTEALRAE